MKIAFCDFWPRHQDDNNYFLHAARMLMPDVEIVHPKDCDVLFFSCFGAQNEQYRNCKRVFYNSESYPNSLFDADFYLSHEYNSENNARFPHWMMVIDWFGVQTYTNPTWLTPPSWFDEETRNPLATNVFDRKFMAAVYTNRTRNREEAVQILSMRFSRVDVYGRPHKLQLEDTNLAKHNVIKDYKFYLAFENGIHDGYVTEKLFHARVANTLPIYWGTKDVGMDFNTNGFIHFDDDYDDMLFPAIEELLREPIKYANMIKEPIFVKTPTIDDALEPIRRAICPAI